MIDQPYVKIAMLQNWHKRAAFQRLALGRLTAVNDVVASIFVILLAQACAFQRLALGQSTAVNDVVASIFLILLAQAGGIPAVGVRAVDCWQ